VGEGVREQLEPKLEAFIELLQTLMPMMPRRCSPKALRTLLTLASNTLVEEFFSDDFDETARAPSS